MHITLLTLDDYIQFICDFHCPIDEITIVLLVRMFHFHISIIMIDKYWTTKCDHDIQGCKIILRWYGKMEFKHMKWIVRDPYDLRNHEIPFPMLSPSAIPQCEPVDPVDPEPSKEPIDPEPEPEFHYHLWSRASAKPTPPPRPVTPPASPNATPPVGTSGNFYST